MTVLRLVGNDGELPKATSLADRLRNVANGLDAGEFPEILTAHLLFESADSLTSFNLSDEEDVYLIGLLAVLQKRLMDDLG